MGIGGHPRLSSDCRHGCRQTEPALDGQTSSPTNDFSGTVLAMASHIAQLGAITHAAALWRANDRGAGPAMFAVYTAGGIADMQTALLLGDSTNVGS